MNKLYWHFTPLWSRKKMRFYSETVGLGQSGVNKAGYCLTIACMYLEIIVGIFATCLYCGISSAQYVQPNFIWQGLTAVAILIVNLALVGDIYSNYYELGYTIWFALDAVMSMLDTVDAWTGTKTEVTEYIDGLEVVKLSVHPIVAVCTTIDAILIFGILIGYIMTHWKVKPAISKHKFKADWKEYKRSM